MGEARMDAPVPEEKVHTAKATPRFTDWGADTLMRKPIPVPTRVPTTKADE